jgi:hypothetical protein
MKKANNHKVNVTPAYPEVLPWFARRAKISETRAKALWDLTCAELDEQSATPAELAKARMAQFIERIGQEAGLPVTPEYTQQPDQFAWLCRHQARLGDMALVASGAIAKFWQQAMTLPQMAR